MNLIDLRVAITVLAFAVFIGIVVWAYSRRRRPEFDEAANLPFSGEDFGPPSRAQPADKDER